MAKKVKAEVVQEEAVAVVGSNGHVSGKSIVEALIGGTRSPGQAPKAPETLSDRMYQGDGHLAMKTRLDARMVGAVARAKTFAALIGFPELDAYANMLMQLHVSLDGKGRAEAVDMARITAITNIGGPATPDTLDG